MQTVNLHDRLLLFYSEVSDGNVDDRFSVAKEVRQNRQAIFSEHNLVSREVIEAAQIHFDRLLSLNVENTKMWRSMKVTGIDGFVTNQTDAHLMIRVADCPPVVIYDPVNHALGLFHAGWRGTVKGIHLAGLSRMVKEYQTDPGKVLIWLGPCIRDCHYTVSVKPDQADDPSWQPYISSQDKKFRINLPQYIKDSLIKEGVTKTHFHDSGICTFESPNLYSHQRSMEGAEPEGRIGIVAKLM